MVFIYFKTPLCVPVKYVLKSIQDLLPNLTAAYLDYSVIYFPSDHCEMWVSVDEKIHMEW